jgi:hypothetical protein
MIPGWGATRVGEDGAHPLSLDDTVRSSRPHHLARSHSRGEPPGWARTGPILCRVSLHDTIMTTLLEKVRGHDGISVFV